MVFECSNGYIKIVEDDMDENTLVIDMVEVYEKRRGTGSRLVKKAIEYAESEGKNLELYAYPQDDSISLEDLIEFYEKLGFQVDYDDGNGALMSYAF